MNTIRTHRETKHTMLRIQFKKKKPLVERKPAQSPSSEWPLGEQFGQSSRQGFEADPFGQPSKQDFEQENIDVGAGNIPNQELDTCLFCGSEITGSHLSVTTKSGEHCMHASCIVSGFALLANGVGLFFHWLSGRYKKK